MRRLTATLIAAALLAGGCGGDGQPEGAASTACAEAWDRLRAPEKERYADRLAATLDVCSPDDWKAESRKENPGHNADVIALSSACRLRQHADRRACR